jgi:putative tricarboxylic transport membrane protein
MIDGLVAAFLDLMTWPTPLYLVLGAVIGLVVGVLPGLGGAGAMALLIPFTFAMEPAQAIAFLMAVGVSSGMGGQVTSILISVPGDPPNAATVVDGYAMTKAGRATEALSAATFGSLFGTVIGLGLMLALLPFARQLVLAFSYPEFFMIAVLGLVVISRLTGNSVHKGLISAAFGLMIAFVGLDPVAGNQRFTFGTLYLWDGIDIVPPLIGLFAGAEMLMLFGARGNKSLATHLEDKSTVLDGFLATIRNWQLIIKSSLIGFFVGLVPGIGGTVTAFLAYGQAARTSKNKANFGKGAVEGVIAPETANDADKGGGLLPTLAFGIPAGVMMAVLLSGLLLHGVPAGPNLLRGDLHIVYVLVVAALLPRLLAGAIVLLLGSKSAIITRIRGDILAPAIAVITLLSVYALRNEILDVFLTLLFCYVGFAMEKYGFSRVTFLIGMVLGGLVEQSFHQTLTAMGPQGFFNRPFSVALIVLVAAMLIVPPVRKLIASRRGTATDEKVEANR